MKITGVVLLIIVMFSVAAGPAQAQFGENKEAYRKMTIQTIEGIAVAAETYAIANEGKYPQGMEDLLNAVPPYLPMDFCGKELYGYKITCEFDRDNGYTITATPVAEGQTTAYQASTGQTQARKIKR